ncbi:HlyD family secretion protein [Hyphomicrobium sp. LHD-15]|uniref:HlyD family secretion protein n=1 Tax=Hyphomicrobium sp. LHD-15 TaxID=3072142 RepID=UPI00280F002F|nr:HlyD family secretion protein [Hyphomicrobium sp. LHD-15]MDQ8700058.1 HlyD family secretion protein [Hyphomicrobium sp. LHD-15]
MLEIALCSLFTILPDYLYRRYAQGKRIGYEITQYSVWFELRWGITTCLMLAMLLITIIFYHHPSTSSATPFFRTIPILPETNGRVSEIFVQWRDEIEKGAPIFKLDSTKQQADLELAKRRISEIDAQKVMTQADIAAAEGQIQQAKGAYQQALEELNTKAELRQRNADVVTVREIERLQNAVDGRKGAVVAAEAARQEAETRISTLLPAQRASAEAALVQAQVDLDKTTVYAGVSGRVEQFILKVGDIVNPFMRPAGILIPSDAGRQQLQAGFGQIEAQVMKVGMAAEAICISKPLTIIPMVVTGVQDYIAAGQVRAGEQLIEVQQVTKPGTLLVFLEPLYQDGLDGVTPGSSCIANAYTSNHDRLEKEDVGALTWLYLHMVDAVGVVHAIILRAQALMLPVRILVLGGH